MGECRKASRLTIPNKAPGNRDLVLRRSKKMTDMSRRSLIQGSLALGAAGFIGAAITCVLVALHVI